MFGWKKDFAKFHKPIMGIYLNTRFQKLHNKQINADNFYASHQHYKRPIFPTLNHSIETMFPPLRYW